MKLKLYQSMRFKLIAILALFAIIPLLCADVLLLSRMEDTLLAEQQAAVDKQLALVNNNVDIVFDGIFSNVKYYAESALLKTADSTVTSYANTLSETMTKPEQSGVVERTIFQSFAEFGAAHPSYQSVYVGLETGGFIQYPSAKLMAGYDPRVRPWYPGATVQPDKTVLGEPYQSADGSGVVITAAQAVKDTAGKVIGVMAVDTSINSLTDLLKDVSEGSKGYFMLVTGNGTILADPSGPDNNFLSLSETYGGEFEKAIEKSATFLEVNLNGQPYVVKSVTAENTGWRYVAVTSKADLLQSVNQIKMLLYLVLAVVLVVAVVAGFLVSTGITKPIKALTGSAQEISEGDFDVDIQIKATGEVGLLVESFQKIGITLRTYKSYIEEISSVLNQIANGNMAFELQSDYMGEFSAVKTALLNISGTLTNTLENIKDASDQIASGSDHVAAGAQSLSQGATEQAASVEELSSTISEVASQIASNAGMAHQANQLSQKAVSDVRVGNEQMQAMVVAMKEISLKTQEINGIIKTIDEIAFQTNILALNAAVEAARAGSAGKGFAVVADEVRNLAQKTAAATHSTADLIQGSIKAVNQGTGIVDKTAGSLAEIAKAVDNMSGLMEGIAEASAQQADSVEQIAQGIDQISSVVQINAATAEESAAASEELSSQASVLNTLVGHFTLSSQAGRHISVRESTPTEDFVTASYQSGNKYF